MIYRCTFYRKQIQERTIFLVFDFLQFDFCETWQTCWSPGNPRDKGKIWCWQCWPACTDPAFKNPHASPFEFKIFPPTQHCRHSALPAELLGDPHVSAARLPPSRSKSGGALAGAALQRAKNVVSQILDSMVPLIWLSCIFRSRLGQ